jgi:hypothetical protein
MISCTNQLAPNDEELFAYVTDDEPLNEEKMSHLKQCPICQQRLRDYQHLHERLLLRLYRSDCPEPTQLMLYFEQVLPIEEVYSINAHLQTCRLCSEEVAEMRAGIANFIPFPEAPISPLERVAQTLRRLVAQPVIQPALVRRSPIPWPRYYQAEDLLLTLHLSRSSDDQMMLLGIFVDDAKDQLKAMEGSLVEIYQLAHEAISAETTPPEIPAEEPFLSTSVDQKGHFSFSSLREGMYTIRVYLPDTELLIEQVKLE